MLTRRSLTSISGPIRTTAFRPYKTTPAATALINNMPQAITSHQSRLQGPGKGSDVRAISTSVPRRQEVGAGGLTPPKPLYASEETIPHLPVPTLSSTLHKYLETIKPHLTTSEFTASKSKVESFLHSSLASTLQARLEARATETESWLSEWWNEAAYMGYRDRLVPNVNYFYVHKEGLRKGKGQVERAAELIRGVRDFRDLVVAESLEPEKVKGKALASSSYKQLFGASRIPSTPSDIPLTYPPHQSEHVILLRKNRFYKLDTKGRGAKELEKAIGEIVKMSEESGEGLGLGAFTSENRDVWTEMREHLLSLDPSNTTSLQTLESAILFVTLEDTSPAPKTREERAWSVWTGGDKAGRNRWFDKHQIVVESDGESGFNGEHSMLDGTPTLRMNEFVLAALDKGKIALELPEGQANKAPLKAEEVKFVTDRKIEQGVKDAIKGFGEVIAAHDLQVLQFDHYGKEAIKAHKCSPDAWVQMIKQLAYGKIYDGAPAVTYESAQTRKFKLGRTEVIRSASGESKAFVDAMLKEGTSDVERAKLLRAACLRHNQYSTWAADGQGVDRHLFGLKKLLRQGEEMPEMFTDVAFGKSSNWTLSTSNLTSEYLSNWGYGEVVPEGFGLSYSIGSEYLRWCVVSTNGRAKELRDSLIWAADEVRRMMDAAGKESGGEVKKAKL